MSEAAFKKVQFGIETTRGTAVAADTVLLCEHPRIIPDRQVTIIEEDIGVRARGTRAHIYQYLVENTLRFPNLYFQALPALFSCGVKGSVTPAQQTGGQGDYLWTFTPSLTAANDPQAMTLELGDNTQAYEVEYVMFPRYRLSWRTASDGGPTPVTLDADYFGRQLATTSFTGSLSLPSAEPVSGKQVRVYRDTSWANVGNTELTNFCRGGDIEILTGVHHKAIDGQLKYFNTHGEGIIAVMATLNMERGAASDAIWDLQQTDPPGKSYIRIRFEGAQIGSGVDHSLEIDLAGFWRDVVPLSDEDRGNNIDVGILESAYDVTGAAMFALKVITNVAAI